MSIKIEGYEILEKAGGTTDTTIWTARQISLDRNVSIWVLKDSAAADQNRVKHFSTITRAISRLKHNNFPPVIDISTTPEGLPYIVFENADSISVTRIIKEHGPYTVENALTIAKEVALALDAAWKQAGLVHRNLKPDNIRISTDGTVKIFNFNSATIVQPGVNPLAFDDGMVVGTPNYASPEQIDCLQSIDFHADMYGLGATLFQMLTGKAPFDTERDPMNILELQRSGYLINPKTLNTNLSDDVVYIIARLMAKRPDDRYAWWLDFVEDIEHVLSGRPLRMVPPNGIVRSTINQHLYVSSPIVGQAAPSKPVVISPVIVPENNAPVTEGYSETVRNPQPAVAQPIVPQPIAPNFEKITPPAGVKRQVKKTNSGDTSRPVNIQKMLYPSKFVVFFTRIFCLALFCGGIFGVVSYLGPARGVVSDETSNAENAVEGETQNTNTTADMPIAATTTEEDVDVPVQEFSSFSVEEDESVAEEVSTTTVSNVSSSSSAVEVTEDNSDAVAEESPRTILLRKAYNELSTKSIVEARISIKKLFDENATKPGINRAECRGILAVLNAAISETEAVGLTLVDQTRIAFKKITVAGKTFEVKAHAYADGDVICTARKVGAKETRRITVPLTKASPKELYEILRVSPDTSKEMTVTKAVLALRTNNRGDFLRLTRKIKSLQGFAEFIK